MRLVPTRYRMNFLKSFETLPDVKLPYLLLLWVKMYNFRGTETKNLKFRLHPYPNGNELGVSMGPKFKGSLGFGKKNQLWNCYATKILRSLKKLDMWSKSTWNKSITRILPYTISHFGPPQVTHTWAWHSRNSFWTNLMALNYQMDHLFLLLHGQKTWIRCENWSENKS